MAAHDSVMVYCSLVRFLLEYACVMIGALLQYLSDSLEIIQKRALAIIFPGSTYIPTFQDRRSAACHEFIVKLNPDNPVYKLGASRLESTSASAHYSLRSRDRVRAETTVTSGFVTNKYATDLTYCVY